MQDIIRLKIMILLAIKSEEFQHHSGYFYRIVIEENCAYCQRETDCKYSSQ